MRKIRVAHVITRLCEGGAQENTFHSVRLANRERYDVNLISGPIIGEEGNLEGEIRARGIAIHREPNLVREISPARDYWTMKSLERRFRAKNYDIVHTHTSKAGVLGRLAAKRAGVPVVIHTPHGNIFDGYFPSWKTRLFVEAERFAARRTDRLVELTPGGVDDYLGRGIGAREQFEVIFSGIDLAPYPAAIAAREATRAQLGIAPGEFLVGTVGRLEPVKGFTYFIAAAKAIVASTPNVRFIHAGQGSLAASLKREATSLGDRLQFLGQRADIPQLMAAMDVLVVPSLNEGMGRVILEAGAARTPVVASAVGGIPDVVRDNVTGVLVTPQSPESIAEAVVALGEDAPRRETMADAANASVVPHFGLENMVMRIEAMYEELIEEKRIVA